MRGDTLLDVEPSKACRGVKLQTPTQALLRRLKSMGVSLAPYFVCVHMGVRNGALSTVSRVCQGYSLRWQVGPFIAGELPPLAGVSPTVSVPS